MEIATRWVAGSVIGKAKCITMFTWPELHSIRIRFGKAASGVTSGFMLDRLHTWRERRDCRPPPWAARVEEPTPDMADSEEVANSADRVEVETE